jgi:hypothetical protein
MSYSRYSKKKKFNNNDYKIGKKKVEVKHCCGHTKTHYIKWDNAERTIDFLETLLCNECEAEKLIEMGAEIQEVSYADYKKYYQPAYIKTVPDSYDDIKKTIEIIATEEEMSNAKTKYLANEMGEEVLEDEY